jgi:predicted nucleic acid-binding protein
LSYLLDTNVLSEMRRPRRAPQNFRAWLASADAHDFYLSPVTLLEIEVGALRAARKELSHAKILRAWIDENIRPNFDARIIPIEEEIALRCAALHVPNGRPYADALIAATALVYGLTVVTRNVRHFEPLGVRLLNPWDA